MKQTQSVEVRREILQSEANDLFKRAAQLSDLADQALEESKAFAKQKKAEADRLLSQSFELRNKARNGYEYVSKAAFVYNNYATRTKEFRDTVTGEVIQTLPMSNGETKNAQTELDELLHAKEIEKKDDFIVEFFFEKFNAEGMNGDQDYVLKGESLKLFQSEQLEWIENNRGRLKSLLVGRLFETDDSLDGTNFDTAYDAVDYHYDEFKALVVADFKKDDSSTVSEVPTIGDMKQTIGEMLGDDSMPEEAEKPKRSHKKKPTPPNVSDNPPVE